MGLRHFLFITLLVSISPRLYGAQNISLWHAYRGMEKLALEQVAQSFNLSHNDVQVKLLAVPFDAYSDKLNALIPLGNGPDIFIGGASGAGYWAEQGFILPLESYLAPDLVDQYFPHSIKAFNFMYPEALWGLPANTKNLALFYNQGYIKNPPQNMDELIKTAQNFTRPQAGALGRWGLSYELGNFYYHALWLHGFGGRMYKHIGNSPSGFPVFLPLLNTRAMRLAFHYVKQKIMGANILPPTPNNTLITQLFNSGAGLYVINGQWFRGEIDPRITYGVSPLPTINETGQKPLPFLTVEGYYLTVNAKDQLAAIEVIKYFDSAAMQKVMAMKGKHTPTHIKTFNYSLVRDDKINQVFVNIAKNGVSLPNGPEASLGWGPFTSALSEMMDGGNEDDVLKLHQKELMNAIESFRKTPQLYKKTDNKSQYPDQ